MATKTNTLTDRQKITVWLTHISAPKDESDEVMELCKANLDARKYYVMRYTTDCACTIT